MREHLLGNSKNRDLKDKQYRCYRWHCRKWPMDGHVFHQSHHRWKLPPLIPAVTGGHFHCQCQCWQGKKLPVGTYPMWRAWARCGPLFSPGSGVCPKWCAARHHSQLAWPGAQLSVWAWLPGGWVPGFGSGPDWGLVLACLEREWRQLHNGRAFWPGAWGGPARMGALAYWRVRWAQSQGAASVTQRLTGAGHNGQWQAKLVASREAQRQMNALWQERWRAYTCKIEGETGDQ